MTTNDIDAIRKLTNAATPGPWKLITDFCDCGGEYGCSHGEFPYGFGPFPHVEHEGNQLTFDDFDFAAAARTLVPALCDEIEQLRSQMADARYTVDQVLAKKDAALAELEKVRGQLTDTRHRADGLANDLRSLQHGHDAYANENARLKHELSQADRVIASLRAEIDEYDAAEVA